MDELPALAKDPSTEKLDEKQKTMLLFMLKATNTTHDTTAGDITNFKTQSNITHIVPFDKY